MDAKAAQFDRRDKVIKLQMLLFSEFGNRQSPKRLYGHLELTVEEKSRILIMYVTVYLCSAWVFVSSILLFEMSHRVQAVKV